MSEHFFGLPWNSCEIDWLSGGLNLFGLALMSEEKNGEIDESQSHAMQLLRKEDRPYPVSILGRSQNRFD